MHGCIHAWPARVLALAVVCGLAAAAPAQQPALPVDTGYHVAADMVEPAPVYHVTNPGYYPVSNSFTADDQALADRVADLESALKKIKEKEESDKKRAASRPKVTVFGRAHLDTAMFSGSALDAGNWAQNTENGTKFRRARLGARGDMFDVFNWCLEMDFAATEGTLQQTAFKDVFLEMTDLPLVQTIKIGHFKEPASLDELISSNHMTLMERSIVNCFIPSRNIGVQVAGHNEMETATFAIGLFREVDDTPPMSTNQDGGNNLTMRGTWLPWYDEATEGRGLLHVGGYYGYRDVDRDGLRFRQRPDNSFSDRIVNTGFMDDAVNWHLLGVELALVYGPFSVQSEYVKALVSRRNTADPDFDAMYVETSYWLTGEHRPYNRAQGRFDRVKPFENFFRVRDEDGCIRMGKGAWQLAYRYGYIDLVSATVDGRRANVHTMGVNWHLTPYSRLMANYIQADRSGDDTWFNAVTMRAQFDF
ncbi:MAG: porin [Thermoguttaceae bacterium]|jgi:phosphate-selective porin OprO/OprP|nr:porin [Thermoguttaceae bacterium]